MNIWQIDEHLFEFTIYNIHKVEHSGQDDYEVVVSGHFSFIWNRITENFVFRKIGLQDGLVSYTRVQENYRIPTRKELKHLKPLVDREILHATYPHRGVASHKNGARLKKSDERIIFANRVCELEEGDYELDFIRDLRKELFITEAPGGHKWRTDKLCFMYCGDDRCNCSASPYYPGNPNSILGMTAKKPKRKTKKPKLR